MNPAFAFSWFYHLRGTGLWEHVAVFWLGCLVGSYAAGLVWRVVTAPPKQVQPSGLPSNILLTACCGHCRDPLLGPTSFGRAATLLNSS